MRKIDRQTSEHYIWKKVCDGWHFVARDDLSVIAEKMPPRASEDMHYHRKAVQFFYILSGQATMMFSEHSEQLHSGTGIEIEPGEVHRMCNLSDRDLEFIVVSMPKSHGDKIVVE